MRHAGLPLLIIALSCLSLAPGPPVLVDAEIPRAPITAAQVRQIDRLQQTPVLTAGASLLADAATGQVLYAHNADTPRPPASLTKVMTALLALDEGQGALTETVRIPAGIQTPGTSAGLAPGEALTLEDLLYGLLLPSGNDAARAVALHIGGTEEAFVAQMNARAASLQMTGTHFANPHGLDDPTHLSTATDLLILTRAALRYPTFAHIVATPTYAVAGHEWENRNQLLTQYPGADGVKTGTTDAAGECLIASASRDGHRLIAIVLGSTDRYADAQALLDYGFAEYTRVRLDLPPGDFRRVRDAGGARVPLGLYDEVWIILPRWQRDHVRSFLLLRTPIPVPGSDVPAGIIEFTLNGQTIGSYPVFVLAREAP
ncbi:MAG: D-alanyl-D-alanine carboxypeptidase [Chloroflexi bacterium]|nr:D-alanyl-D-alanine carboxypeptidase [Chloroflexota bacterium]MBU1751898.1 D-alanyl-D-alanine carboxypeptidase [Chloroflexota bacterium]